MFDMFPLPDELIEELSNLDTDIEEPDDIQPLDYNLDPRTELSEDVFNTFIYKELT